MGADSRLKCPDCGAGSVPLSLSDVRRKRRVTCNQCGSKLEIVVPAGIYSLVTWTSAILGTTLAPFLLLFALAKEWLTVALSIALLAALIFGSNAFLNRRATVQRAPEPDPNPSALRRWFTD
jgi:hypothetical protein